VEIYCPSCVGGDRRLEGQGEGDGGGGGEAERDPGRSGEADDVYGQVS